MTFLQHNFVSNLTNAVRSKDNRLVKYLIVGELSKVLVANRNAVLDILAKNNIRVSKWDSNKKLSDLIASNINTNPKLLQDISSLLIKYSKMETSAFGFNFCDDNKTLTSKVLENPEFNFALSNGMRKYITPDNCAEIHNLIDTNEKLQNITVEKPTAEVKKFFKNKTVKVVTYLGLAIAVGYGFNYFYKKYRAKKMMPNDSEPLEPVTPVAETQPIAVTPPTAPPAPSYPVNPNVTLV